ncbi:ABC transporter permease [soil metagenome]
MGHSLFGPVRRAATPTMWRFAWQNLLTRPLRTVLALVGLSIPILGVLGLFSLSGGLRNLVGDTLSQIQGLMIVRENALSPVFSDLPANLEERIAAVPGVKVVAPEILKTSPTIEDRNTFVRASEFLKAKTEEQRIQTVFDQPIVQGQDIPSHRELRSAVFPSKLLPPEEGGGRFLEVSDMGKPHIVISRKIARDYPVTEEDGQQRPRQVGDTLHIKGKPFEVIGIYDTGSIFLDVMIIMDIAVARELLGVSPETVSSFYVEATDPALNDEVAMRIEEALVDHGIDARSMEEFTANFGRLMSELDLFLLMTVSLALLVGVVGIVNTMLMSTTERFTEFGVLRTNGWSRSNILTLVTAESAYLGLWAGLVGCGLALLGVAIANQFIGGGLQLTIGANLLALGLGLSVVMGVLGGLYPAWRASRLVPMDAIRLGAH